MVEQIKNAKFVNSININSRETIYFAHKDYDITLDGIIFRMECRRSHDIAYSSLMNNISFNKLDEPPKDLPEEPKTGMRTKRGQ